MFRHSQKQKQSANVRPCVSDTSLSQGLFQAFSVWSLRLLIRHFLLSYSGREWECSRSVRSSAVYFPKTGFSGWADQFFCSKHQSKHVSLNVNVSVTFRYSMYTAVQQIEMH